MSDIMVEVEGTQSRESADLHPKSTPLLVSHNLSELTFPCLESGNSNLFSCCLCEYKEM